MTDDAAFHDIPDELLASWQDLSTEERRELARTWQLAATVRDPDPNPHEIDEAEERLLHAVANRGGTTPSGARPPARKSAPLSDRARRIRIAASVLLFAAAGALLYLFIQPTEEPRSMTASHEFMLLLHGEPLVRYPAEEHERIIGDYVAWARELGESGRFVAGNELAPGGRILAAQNGAIQAHEIDDVESAVSGYFIVAAADLDEAARIAADCPHLKYDGTVEIRQIGTN